MMPYVLSIGKQAKFQALLTNPCMPGGKEELASSLGTGRYYRSILRFDGFLGTATRND